MVDQVACSSLYTTDTLILQHTSSIHRVVGYLIRMNRSTLHPTSVYFPLSLENKTTASPSPSCATVPVLTTKKKYSAFERRSLEQFISVNPSLPSKIGIRSVLRPDLISPSPPACMLFSERPQSKQNRLSVAVNPFAGGLSTKKVELEIMHFCGQFRNENGKTKAGNKPVNTEAKESVTFISKQGKCIPR